MILNRDFVSPRRAALVILTILLAGVAAWSADLHHQVLRIVEWSEPVLARHPGWGAVLFVVLAALSAAVVFFSSVLLVPFGVHEWGVTGCFFLLWTGWLIGGILTYAVGRGLGSPIVRWMLTPSRAAEYEARIPASQSFLPVLIVQLAFPSEAVGYLCGLVKVPPLTYLGALAVAELPYALSAVLLGTAFFRREYVLLFSLALGGSLLLGWLWWRHKKSRPGPPESTAQGSRVADGRM